MYLAGLKWSENGLFSPMTARTASLLIHVCLEVAGGFVNRFVTF